MKNTRIITNRRKYKKVTNKWSMPQNNLPIQRDKV